jgi:hypothetical protein
MAYDSARDVTVLFGGTDNSSHLGDTWEWDGNAWTLRSSSGPTERAGHAMAYDSARGVTVLFGGLDVFYNEFGDTWEWDGSAWTLQSNSGPSPRFSPAMAYDSARDVTVLFGGWDDIVNVGDTWEWDGSAWTLRSNSGPSPREHHAMAYDSAREVTVLFGGAENSDSFGDTWEFGCGLTVLLPPTTGEDTCWTGTTNTGIRCATNADCAAGSVCGMKSRYLSITPTNSVVAGATTSIQVEIVSAKQCAGGANAGRGCEGNVQCPASTCVNSPNIGDIWWAGAEVSIPNSPQAALKGSLLQCSASPVNAQVWSNGVLHLWGSAIVPFASYNVRMCDAAGNNCSDPLLVGTGEWGDCVAPYGGVSQPAFGDINEIVFKFRNLGTSLAMPRVDLVGTGNPGQPNVSGVNGNTANFGDIGACVEGFRGIGYAYTVPACP